MTDFNDTAIAFRAKSDSELRRSYRLFRMMESPWLVRLGTRAISVALKTHLPVETAIRRTLFRQFCGGETIAECSRTIGELARFRVGTILDYSVEGSGSETELDATCREICGTIELAHHNPNVPFCVFKMTGIARFELLEKSAAGMALSTAEQAEWKRARGRVESICALAHRHGVRVFIDAEETWIQGAIDALATEMMERFNRERALIYNTLQMYRRDRLAYLHDSFGAAQAKGYFLGIKLVRGAYLEKERDRAAARKTESTLFSEKVATDLSFDSALDYCVPRLERIALCAGTHNESSCRRLIDLMHRHAVAKQDPRVYFAQLLGMSDHLSYNLADAGYGVAKYVPYGPVRSVLPYLFRRAEENTSIRGQSGRELSLLTQELVRRRRLRANGG
jgi:proline dehydrogenase